MFKDYKGLQVLSLVIGMSVLTSCLPEDEAVLSERDSRQIESQVKMYSQAFQQYSNRSLNAMVNSSAWQSSGPAAIPQGKLDLGNPIFGSLSMGTAEDYIESALCSQAGDYYHLTWFEPQSSTGKLSLKGLGEGASGQASLKVKNLMPAGNYGLYSGSSIKMMNDGTTLSLSGACSTLDMPQGTAVAAYMIPVPLDTTDVVVKSIMRGQACPDGQGGGIMQKISATYSSDGNIYVGGSAYSSEQDVVDNHASGWSESANNCLTTVASLDRTITDGTASAINVASIGGYSGDVKDELEGNLSNIDCRQSNTKNDDDEDVREFETCGEGGNIDGLDNTEINERTLLRTEETIVMAQCPNTNGQNRTVTINTAHEDFAGISSSMNGSQAMWSSGAMAGEVSINQITRVYEVKTDTGNVDSQGNKIYTTSEIEEVTQEGLDIACEQPLTLTASCESMYPGVDFGQSTTASGSSNPATDSGTRYKFNDHPVMLELYKQQYSEGTPFQPDANYEYTYQEVMDIADYLEENISSLRAFSVVTYHENWFLEGSIHNEPEDGMENIGIVIQASGDLGTIPFKKVEGTSLSIATPVVQNGGLQYSRKRLINGWADTSLLTPNDAIYESSWSAQGTGAVRCMYLETTIERCRIEGLNYTTYSYANRWLMEANGPNNNNPKRIELYDRKKTGEKCREHDKGI